MFQKLSDFLLINTSTKQRVLKNTFWLFSGQIGSRVVKLWLIIYAARTLGATGWGAFSYALGIAAFFTIFVDFGVNAIITREASRDPQVQKQYFATALGVKIVLFFVVSLLIILLAPLLIKDPTIGILIPLVALIVGFDSLRDFAAAMSRAWERMEIEAAMQVATNAFILIAGLAMLYVSSTPQSLAAGYAMGTGLGMLLAFYPCRGYFRGIREAFSMKLIRPIFASSLPFAISGLMGAILLNTDTILIGWLLDLTEVGYYAAAQRIALLIYMIPGLISIAFFPAMAKAVSDPKKQRLILEKITGLQFLTALPFTVGGIILSGPIISLLYGESYAPATLSFLIMNLTYLPVFLATVFTNGVFALGEEKKLFISSLIGITGNFILDLVFIPRWGIAGSALATTLNQIVIAAFLWHLLKKRTGFVVLPSLKKIIISTVLMTTVLLPLQYIGTPIYFMILIGGSVYIGSLLLLKEELVFETLKTFTDSQPESIL